MIRIFIFDLDSYNHSIVQWKLLSSRINLSKQIILRINKKMLQVIAVMNIHM